VGIYRYRRRPDFFEMAALAQKGKLYRLRLLQM